MQNGWHEYHKATHITCQSKFFRRVLVEVGIHSHLYVLYKLSVFRLMSKPICYILTKISPSPLIGERPDKFWPCITACRRKVSGQLLQGISRRIWFVQCGWHGMEKLVHSRGDSPLGDPQSAIDISHRIRYTVIPTFGWCFIVFM